MKHGIIKTAKFINFKEYEAINRIKENVQKEIQRNFYEVESIPTLIHSHQTWTTEIKHASKTEEAKIKWRHASAQNQKKWNVLNIWVTTYIQEYYLIIWTEHKKTAKKLHLHSSQGGIQILIASSWQNRYEHNTWRAENRGKEWVQWIWSGQLHEKIVKNDISRQWRKHYRHLTRMQLPLMSYQSSWSTQKAGRMPSLTAPRSSVNFTAYKVTTGQQNSRKTEKNEDATLNPEFIFLVA